MKEGLWLEHLFMFEPNFNHLEIECAGKHQNFQTMQPCQKKDVPMPNRHIFQCAH